MSLVDRSRESWLSATLRPKFSETKGIRGWLSDDAWTPNAGMTQKEIKGTVHTLDSLGDACTRDAIRFGIAAFESAARADSPATDERSCAWQFIRYYYAAYFAANGLMRLSGHACVNLNTIECTAINAWANAHGVGGSTERNKITPGAFRLSLDTTSTPTFSLRSIPGKGGVHIQFWSAFSHFLASLRTDITRSPAPKVERDAAIKELDLLKTDLGQTAETNSSWLSEIRNSVNYRFEHGVWFPYEDSAAQKTALRESFKAHAANPKSFIQAPASAPELVRAGRVCGFLVGWLEDSLSLIAHQAKGEKSSLTKGALDLAKMI